MAKVFETKYRIIKEKKEKMYEEVQNHENKKLTAHRRRVMYKSYFIQAMRSRVVVFHSNSIVILFITICH